MTNKEMIMNDEKELIRILYLVSSGNLQFYDTLGESACDYCNFRQKGINEECPEDDFRTCPETYVIKSWLEAPAGQNRNVPLCEEFKEHLRKGYAGLKDTDPEYCVDKRDIENINWRVES